MRGIKDGYLGGEKVDLQKRRNVGEVRLTGLRWVFSSGRNHFLCGEINEKRKDSF